MNFSETLDYLYSKLPMFTRQGAKAIKKDLHNTLAFCEYLGNPQKHLKTIHVAGTNGKGSTSHALASIMQSSGYKTGLYTSPHLVDFRERIRVDGQVVPQEWVVDFVKKHSDYIEDLKPSFFEVTVVMAFQYFYESGVDIAVIETGLGGRLDSTNIIHPELSLITNISWDHADVLGDSLISIATEKAGIIKNQVPVVISEYQDEVAPIFIHAADQNQAKLYFASAYLRANFSKNDGDAQWIQMEKLTETPRELDEFLPELHNATIKLDLQGNYQLKNLPGVLVTCKVLHSIGWEKIQFSTVLQGLQAIQKNTGLQGRWQKLQLRPLVICDTGHNEEGWKNILENISLLTYQKLHFVLGVMKDKDLSKMLPVLPTHATYYFCHVNMPRALDSQILKESASEIGLKGEAYSSCELAVKAALEQAKEEDVVFIGGSTFVVAEVLEKWN